MKIKQLKFFKNDYLRLATGAFLISFSAIFVKISSVPPDLAAFYRNGIATFVFLLILIYKKISFKIPGKSLMILGLAGICYFADLSCWHRAIFAVGPGLATLLGNLQVFLLSLVSILIFHERPKLKFYIGLIFAFLGIFLLVGVKWQKITPDYKTGILFALFAAIFYTAYITSLRIASENKKTNKNKFSTFLVMFIVSGSSALFCLIFILATKQNISLNNHQDVFLMIIYSLNSQVLGWYLISDALPRVKTSLAGLILLIQPAFSFIWDVLLLHRQTTPLEFLGFFIAITAIYLGSRK